MEMHIDSETGYSVNTFTNVRDTHSGVWYRLWGAVPAYTNIIRMIWSLCRALAAVGGGRVYRDSSDGAATFSVTALSYLYRGVVKTMNASTGNTMSGGDGVYSIYAIPSSTAVQVSAVGGGWPVGPHVRLAQITLSAGAWSQISGVADQRAACDLRVLGEGPSGTKVVTALATGTLALGASDCGTRFVNTGASAMVQFTLPAATVGLWYEFAVTVAQSLRVATSGTNTIRIEGNTCSSGGYTASNTVGDAITLECVETGKWLAVGGSRVASGWLLN